MKFCFILFLFSKMAFSYEWQQLTEKGILEKKSIFQSSIETTKVESNLIKKKISTLTKISIMGDTGCRLKDKKDGKPGDYQDCNDPALWPFPTIVKSVINDRPELVIHLGDFHYREQCSQGKICEKLTEVGYGIQPWDLDFFKPMEALLSMAPLLIVRGNHEDCQRAYLGYKFFLKNDDWQNPCETIEKSQVIKLSNLTLINFDSSAISDNPGLSDVEEKKWIHEFDDIASKLNPLSKNPVWLITHKPIYGVAPFMKTFVPVNLNLRKVFEKSLLAKKVNLIMSGHIHASAVIKGKDFPTQIILGNSGTKIDNMKYPVNPNLLKLLNYDSLQIIDMDFGEGLLELKNNTWSLSFKNQNGKEIFKLNNL